MLRRISTILSLALIGCCSLACDAAPPSTFEGDGYTIERIALDPGSGLTSNAFLVERGGRHLLVDAGEQKTVAALLEALAARGVGEGDLEMLVLTHGHPDHAGGAAALQADLKAPVLVHEGDLATVQTGEAGAPPLQTAEGFIVQFLIDTSPYPGVTPDVVVGGEDEVALPLGARFLPMAGHTPGTAAIVIGTDAFVGDMFRADDGAEENAAQTQVFGEDLEADRAHAWELLDMGIERFFVAHGGMVPAQRLRAWLGG